MITLQWEPTDTTSIVIADGLVEDYVKSIVEKHKTEDINLKIGSELILQYLRVCIVEGELYHEDLQLLTNGGKVLIIFDEDSRMDSLIGYPDYWEKSLDRLLKWE